MADDAGYASRVLSEHELLKAVAGGRAIAPSAVNRPMREASAPAEASPAQVALLDH
jgi:hypothetical protein